MNQLQGSIPIIYGGLKIRITSTINPLNHEFQLHNI